MAPDQTPNQLNQRKLEYACFSVLGVLHDQLQRRNISAIEFLSMVEQLPVKPADMRHYEVRNG